MADGHPQKRPSMLAKLQESKDRDLAERLCREGSDEGGGGGGGGLGDVLTTSK